MTPFFSNAPLPGPASRLGDAALAPEIQAQIGSRLRAAYDDVLHQSVPERFRLLLDQLDAKAATIAGSQKPLQN